MKIYVTKFASYEPSPDNPVELPKLEYVDPLFRRRLSQLTRMTIEVVHRLIEESPKTELQKLLSSKLCFTSFRGEIARQLKINKGLVEDAGVLPAQFSLSVFNTPAAATTIALGMKKGYTAIYPGNDSFSSALVSAAVSITGTNEKEIIFVYADEKLPDEYSKCKGYGEKLPLAFACRLSAEKSEGSKELILDKDYLSSRASSPQVFLDYLKK